MVTPDLTGFRLFIDGREIGSAVRDKDDVPLPSTYPLLSNGLEIELDFELNWIEWFKLRALLAGLSEAD